MNDSEFEQILLQSARGDAPPDDARDAWARLSLTLSSLGSSAVPRGHRRGPAAWENPIVARAPSWPGSARTAAMKWLLVGAIGGGAVTAAIMVRFRAGETSAPATVVALESTAPARTTGAASAPSRVTAPDVGATPVAPTPLAAPTALAPPATHPRHGGQLRGRALSDASGPTVSASTLAAEVSRIDAARSADASGAYDEALWLIDRYHRDFPDGVLAPDAEVVALEAVAAERDGPEIARRAALFLARYPDDPHAARVRWLAAHRGADRQ